MAEVKIKLGKLMAIRPSITELMNLEMPILPSYKATKIFKALDEEFKQFEDKRKDLVKKYGEVVEGSQNGDIRVKEENLAEFNKEFNELTNHEITVNVDIIRIAEFGDKTTLSPKVLIELDDFIKDS